MNKDGLGQNQLIFIFFEVLMRGNLICLVLYLMKIFSKSRSIFLNSSAPLSSGICDHPEDRCIISQVQINCDGKWHCKFCQGIAHEDIEEETPYCPICDIPLLPYDPSMQ